MGKASDAVLGFGIILFVVILIGAAVWVFVINPWNVTDEPNSEEISVRELPESCNGVLSTDSFLYPTAEQCMTFLYLDLYAPCLNLDPAESETCMDKLDFALDRECKTLEKTLGIDYEVCLVDTLKRLYQKTGGS